MLNTRKSRGKKNKRFFPHANHYFHIGRYDKTLQRFGSVTKGKRMSLACALIMSGRKFRSLRDVRKWRLAKKAMQVSSEWHPKEFLRQAARQFHVLIVLYEHDRKQRELIGHGSAVYVMYNEMS